MTCRGVSLWFTATVYFCFSQLGDSYKNNEPKT
jgi:hypothetical protein